MLFRILCIAVLLPGLLPGLVPGGGGGLAAQDQVDFAHDILPILKSRCAECHTNGVFQGGLSLETRDRLLESGSVEVGSRHDSELFLRVTSADADDRMPPEGQPLTPEQIERIGQWIDGGLDWPNELSLRQKTFSRPLPLSPPDLADAVARGEHPIDVLIDAWFREHSLTWPGPLDNARFLRRAKLDLLGLLPEPAEIASFADADDPSARERLIDELLDRPRDYADHWMSFWNDLLRNDYAGTGYIDGGRQQITGWLHRSLLENKPYDRFVRELIRPDKASEGFIRGIKWRGEVNASQIQPLQFSQNISQVFLGINMKCASCHDSFIDHWKLDDAYGLAAVISDEPLEMHRCDVPTGQYAESRFVFPQLGEIDGTLPRAERLGQLSDLLTSADNGRLSRTIVNRIWDRLIGRGLVFPVDVMANPAWSEPLLDYLAADLANHGYDLKRTMRLIATSRIYRSQSVTPQPGSADEAFVFQGVVPKRMTAEQFVDAVWNLTGQHPARPDAAIGETDPPDSPVRVRAALVKSNLLMRSLGRPNREQVVTSRPAELSTLQALGLSNGDLLSGWLQAGAQKWLAAQRQNGWTNRQLVRQIFFQALSREPNEGEMDVLDFTDPENAQAAVEDVLWIVTMLPEFQLVR